MTRGLARGACSARRKEGAAPSNGPHKVEQFPVTHVVRALAKTAAPCPQLEETMTLTGCRPLTTPTPTFSVSIEWENSRFADLDRTRQMLRALRSQLIELTPPAEPPCVNLLYDPGSIDGEMRSYGDTIHN